MSYNLFVEKERAERSGLGILIEERLTEEADKIREDRVRQVNELIQEAINQLSTPLRQVLNMFYFDGLSSKDIAKNLGKSEGYVKTTLYSAKKKMRSKLSPEIIWMSRI